ncbi:MAG: DNA alkylation repair protein [Marinilabiliaceae bacterium]|nr:DNA alkylation repair protein [Marinilabiliaceae bacterium]
MKYYLNDPKVENDFNQILQLINLRKNGEVADLMKTEQNSYIVSYGVSAMHIKEIAQLFKKNTLLSSKLWFMGVRETMIIATMLIDFDSYNIDDCNEWINEIKTSEVADLFAQNVLSKLDFAFNVVNGLYDNSNVLDLSIANWTVGWMLRNSSLNAGMETEFVLSKVKVKYDDSFFLRSVSFLMRQLIRNSLDGKDQVLIWLNANKNNDNYSTKWIFEDINTELNWGGSSDNINN